METQTKEDYIEKFYKEYVSDSFSDGNELFCHTLNNRRQRFLKEYEIFVDYKKERLISEFAYMYDTLTENYDKTVCHFFSEYDGKALPIFQSERIACNISAKRVMDRILFLCANYGITSKDILHYLRDHK